MRRFALPGKSPTTELICAMPIFMGGAKFAQSPSMRKKKGLHAVWELTHLGFDGSQKLCEQ
jgi:hypothetical protein